MTTISWNFRKIMNKISMKLTWWEQIEVLCFRHLRQRTLYANFVESGSNHPEDTKSGKENIFEILGTSNHLSFVSKFCFWFIIGKWFSMVIPSTIKNSCEFGGASNWIISKISFEQIIRILVRSFLQKWICRTTILNEYFFYRPNTKSLQL